MWEQNVLVYLKQCSRLRNGMELAAVAAVFEDIPICFLVPGISLLRHKIKVVDTVRGFSREGRPPVVDR